MQDLRIALVGCGGIGMGQGRRIQRMPGAAITAVSDIHPEHRAEAAQTFGVPAYEDLGALLSAERDKLDGVICTVAAKAHADVTVACLEAGLSVFCEEPMATSFADCARMVEAQGKPRPFVQVGFVVRHNDIFRQVREIVDSGEIGEVRSVYFVQCPGPERSNNHPHHFVPGGGLFVDKLSHAIDIFHMLLGECEDVTAVHAPNVMPQYTQPDNMSAVYRFGGGKTAQIMYVVGRAVEGELDTDEQFVTGGHWLEYVIVGTKGSVSYPLWERCLKVTHLIDGHVALARRICLDGNDGEVPYHDCRLELQAFLDALRAGGPPAQTAEDALESMRIIFASERAAREGRTVRVAEIH